MFAYQFKVTALLDIRVLPQPRTKQKVKTHCMYHTEVINSLPLPSPTYQRHLSFWIPNFDMETNKFLAIWLWKSPEIKRRWSRLDGVNQRYLRFLHGRKGSELMNWLGYHVRSMSGSCCSIFYLKGRYIVSRCLKQLLPSPVRNENTCSMD